MHMGSTTEKGRRYQEQVERLLKQNAEALVKCDAKPKSRSGQERTLDLLIEYPFEVFFGDVVDEPLTIKIAVDCKDHERPVDMVRLGQFADQMDDLGIPLGLMVTSNGYTEGARRRAAVKNVFVVEADSEWKHFADRLREETAPFVRTKTATVQQIGGSQLRFADLLPRAKEEVYIAGQNLHSILSKGQSNTTWNAICDWLDGSDCRTLHISIMRLEDNPGVDVWGRWLQRRVRFREDLKESVETLCEWQESDAVKQRRVRIRLIDFVPLTATFLDPRATDGSGQLILTPVVHPCGETRPTFLVKKNRPASKVFRHYWSAYRRLFA